MRAAIYCRLSKEDAGTDRRGGESESIQNQKSMLIRYALEHGYEVGPIYIDEDYSGADRRRPAFNRMIEAAGQGRFEVILAKTQSRFTRDMELVEKYLHGRFVAWGVRFIAVVDHVDTADAAGKKSRQLNGLVNEWYLEDLSASVRSVLTHKRRQGKHIGAFAPYGYQKDPADRNHLLVDPVAAGTVRRIFALYLAGNGTARIARLLNEEGVPSPTRYKRALGLAYKGAAHSPAEDLWGKATVYRMLTNRTYAGDMEQGRHQKASYKSNKTLWVPKEKWIVVPGTHEGIIDRETFARVQQMLGQHARSGVGGAIHPLAGKVFCGMCGAAMEQTGSGGGARRYFRCRTAQRDKTRCPGQAYLPAEQLQQLVLEQVRHHIAGRLGAGPPEAWLEADPAAGRHAVERGELEHLQREIRRRRQAIRELYLDKAGGFLSPGQFQALNEAFLQEVQVLEHRCEKLAAALEAEEDPACRRQALCRRWDAFRQVKTLNRDLACLLIEKVVVYPPDTKNTRTVEIHWTF